MMGKFDAIIIGSEKARTSLALRMAAVGLKIVFVEKEHFGSTCLNVGCTPSKTYVDSARRNREVMHGDELGILIPEGKINDLKKVKARKDALVKKSVDGISGGYNTIKMLHILKVRQSLQVIKLLWSGVFHTYYL